MSFFDWDRAKADEYQIPQVDDVAFRFICKKLGGGSLACGKWILRQIIAHVDHADTAHPWDKTVTTRQGMNLADAEFDEAKEQLSLALESGLENPDEFFVDDNYLAERCAHLDYEIGDTIAVLIKLLRKAYGDSMRNEC